MNQYEIIDRTTSESISSLNSKQIDMVIVGLLEGLVRALECFSSTLDIIENSI